MPAKKVVKKKDAKKKVELTKKDEDELQKRYVALFKNVVTIIQKENNAALVYQVLTDITHQIEQQLRIKTKSCNCSDHTCGECDQE